MLNIVLVVAVPVAHLLTWRFLEERAAVSASWFLILFLRSISLVAEPLALPPGSVAAPAPPTQTNTLWLLHQEPASPLSYSCHLWGLLKV